MVPLLRYPGEKAKNYFALQTTVLKALGVSFTGNESRLYRIYSTLWLSSVFLTFTIVEFYEIYIYFDDMDLLVSNLSYLGTDILGLIKVSILLYHRLRIGKTLDSMEKGIFAPDNLRGGRLEFDLIKNCILISNRQTCLYYLSVVMVCVLGATATMLKRILYGNSQHWEMPYMTFSWFDTNRSPIFEIIWFYQLWWRALYALIVSSTDSLIAGLLAFISTQCKMLQNSIKHTISNANKECLQLYADNDHEGNDNNLQSPSSIPRNILRKYLKNIVNYHQGIINLAEEFEEQFSFLVLTIFAATLFILCFVMYHASLFDLLSMRAAQDFSYVALIAIQVFLYCYWGNEVRLQSEKIAGACWDMDFVGTDGSFQKSLSLVIRRCQKPIVLTAGKFTDLSLRTYAWIIRASYSYYMVLRNYHH